jgi:hypothetical protein
VQATDPKIPTNPKTEQQSVVQMVGFLKGKSAIRIARVFGGRRRNLVGQQFWARAVTG